MTKLNQVTGTEVEVKETAAAKKARLKAEKEAKALADAQAKEQAVAVATKTVEIMVSGITSGKMEHSIFSFTFNKKRITTPFFPVLIGKPGIYEYDHHLDAERLTQLDAMHEEFSFFAFDKRNEQEQYKAITIASYGELMKYNLYRLIASGKLTRVVNDTNYVMKWSGDAIEEPTLKVKVDKPKKDKAVKSEELAGLDFFN